MKRLSLAVLFLKGKFVSEDRHVISRIIQKLYNPVVGFVVRHRMPVILVALAMVAVTVPVFHKLRRR